MKAYFQAIEHKVVFEYLKKPSSNSNRLSFQLKQERARGRESLFRLSGGWLSRGPRRPASQLCWRGWRIAPGSHKVASPFKLFLAHGNVCHPALQVPFKGRSTTASSNEASAVYGDANASNCPLYFSVFPVWLFDKRKPRFPDLPTKPILLGEACYLPAITSRENTRISNLSFPGLLHDVLSVSRKWKDL